MGKKLQKVLLAFLFLLGLAVFSYPYAQGLLLKREMESTIQTFQAQQETQPTSEISPEGRSRLAMFQRLDMLG